MKTPHLVLVAHFVFHEFVISGIAVKSIIFVLILYYLLSHMHVHTPSSPTHIYTRVCALTHIHSDISSVLIFVVGLYFYLSQHDSV